MSEQFKVEKNTGLVIKQKIFCDILDWLKWEWMLTMTQKNLLYYIAQLFILFGIHNFVYPRCKLCILAKCSMARKVVYLPVFHLWNWELRKKKSLFNNIACIFQWQCDGWRHLHNYGISWVATQLHLADNRVYKIYQ